MSRKYFVRMVDLYGNGCKRDRIFLKPMTIQEYVIFVNMKIKAIKRNCESTLEIYAEFLNTANSGIYREHIQNDLTFAFYPVPASGYIVKNYWIDTKNLKKYVIKEGSN
jgi:hypothetical protein